MCPGIVTQRRPIAGGHEAKRALLVHCRWGVDLERPFWLRQASLGSMHAASMLSIGSCATSRAALQQL